MGEKRAHVLSFYPSGDVAAAVAAAAAVVVVAVMAYFLALSLVVCVCIVGERARIFRDHKHPQESIARA